MKIIKNWMLGILVLIGWWNRSERFWEVIGEVGIKLRDCSVLEIKRRIYF